MRGERMLVREAPVEPAPTAARKRAAVEAIARHGEELRRFALRYSLCTADADDAYQRALEILLTKAPPLRAPELLRWTRTVVKHEALAVRRSRERLLGTAATDKEDGGAAAARLPSPDDGPELRAEDREDVARSREALRLLRPAELRVLALLGAGCSYVEIAAITGFSRRKVKRCTAEGRERFRRFVSHGERGARCAEMGRLLSAFCDGETSAAETAAVRAHLGACAGCRATVRAYRAVPAAAALAPTLPASRSLLERAQELLADLHSRLPGGGAGADAGVAQVAAAGGGRGLGVAATAKLLALCAGTVGGAACVAGGVAPAPLGLGPPAAKEPRVERVAEQVVEPAPPAVEYEPEPEPPPPEPEPPPVPPAAPEPPVEPAPGASEAGAVEYEPPPSSPSSEPSGGASGSAAGEFGP